MAEAQSRSRWPRHVEGVGGLVDGEPREELELDDARQPLVHPRQSLERGVERQHVDDVRRRPEHVLELIIVSSPPRFAALPPGVVDEDLPHQPRGKREEMRSVLERQSMDSTKRKYVSCTSAVVWSGWPSRRLEAARAAMRRRSA